MAVKATATQSRDMSSRPSSARDPWFLALLALLVAYLALILYAGATADPTADLGIEVLFAAIVGVLGGSVLSEADGDRVLLVAGWALVAAAVAELASIAGVAVADPAASLLLLGGVGLYLYDRFLR